MIVITDRAGQLCNRLWAITPFIALSLEHNIRLFIINFDHYARYFENVTRYKNITIGVCNHYYTYRAFIKLLNVSKAVTFTKRIVHYQNKIDSFQNLERLLTKEKKIHLIEAWHQPYDINLLANYKNEIRILFSPEQNSKKTVDTMFTDLKEEGTVIVGVHIRRKDYRHFRNGKYFYSDDVYKNLMRSISNELQKKKKKAVFLICSDSNLNLAEYKEYSVVKNDNPTPIQDLYALSKCDYIAGPPSTFSMWASFYGDVPLRFLIHNHDQVSLSEFSPIIAQNRFKNGQIFSHEP